MLSGFSHVRYDHSSRPRVLDVVCPKCRSRATSYKDSELEKGHLIGDLAGTWHLEDWNIKCLSCSFRKSNTKYTQLPPPYYKVTARDIELWAFNHDHFLMLLRLLDGEDIAGEPYEWFATYAHRDWLKTSNRERLVKQMRRFLDSDQS